LIDLTFKSPGSVLFLAGSFWSSTVSMPSLAPFPARHAGVAVVREAVAVYDASDLSSAMVKVGNDADVLVLPKIAMTL